LIALTAFLTLVDLFATQALLPALAQRYAVSPAAMGVAVNACTLGMAVSSLAVALVSGRIQRRGGIWVSLALLAIPTVLLSAAPDLVTFAALRVAQGIFMAAAFALMLAYLGEHFGPQDAAGAFAAYVTGNVASNLFGRLFASAVADHLGLSASFIVFALLNLAGAALVYATVRATPRPDAAPSAPRTARIDILRNGPLLAGLGIGFCILFAFIGTFTYVNFVLAAGAPSRDSARAPRCGTRLALPPWACRCCSHRRWPPCWPDSRWSASAHSWRRPPPPASSARPRRPTARWRAGCTSPAISSAGWAAARCSGSSTCIGVGSPA
jgi:predicted MFS family arabinose efflux permease